MITKKTFFVFKSWAGLFELLFLIVKWIWVHSRDFGTEVRVGKFLKLKSPLTPHAQRSQCCGFDVHLAQFCLCRHIPKCRMLTVPWHLATRDITFLFPNQSSVWLSLVKRLKSVIWGLHPMPHIGPGLLCSGERAKHGPGDRRSLLLLSTQGAAATRQQFFTRCRCCGPRWHQDASHRGSLCRAFAEPQRPLLLLQSHGLVSYPHRHPGHHPPGTRLWVRFPTSEKVWDTCQPTLSTTYHGPLYPWSTKGPSSFFFIGLNPSRQKSTWSLSWFLKGCLILISPSVGGAPPQEEEGIYFHFSLIHQNKVK